MLAVETLSSLVTLGLVVGLVLSLVMEGPVVDTLLSVDVLVLVVEPPSTVVLLVVVGMVEMLPSVDILGLVGETFTVVPLFVVDSPGGGVAVRSVVLGGTVVVTPGRKADFYVLVLPTMK